MKLFIHQEICYGQFDCTLWMPYDKKNFIKRKRRTKHWSIILNVNLYLGIYSRHENIFIYINITKNYKHEHIKDMKICVNHDGSWRRINKDLAMMNHTSEKSKQGSWRRGTGCDGEGQVDVWIRGIKLAMESRISLSVNLYWIKI